MSILKYQGSEIKCRSVWSPYACNRKPNMHKNIPQPSTNNNTPLIIKDNDCRGDETNFHAHHPSIKHAIIKSIKIHTSYENH